MALLDRLKNWWKPGRTEEVVVVGPLTQDTTVKDGGGGAIKDVDRAMQTVGDVTRTDSPVSMGVDVLPTALLMMYNATKKDVALLHAAHKVLTDDPSWSAPREVTDVARQWAKQGDWVATAFAMHHEFLNNDSPQVHVQWAYDPGHADAFSDAHRATQALLASLVEQYPDPKTLKNILLGDGARMSDVVWTQFPLGSPLTRPSGPAAPWMTGLEVFTHDGSTVAEAVVQSLVERSSTITSDEWVGWEHVAAVLAPFKGNDTLMSAFQRSFDTGALENRPGLLNALQGAQDAPSVTLESEQLRTALQSDGFFDADSDGRERAFAQVLQAVSEGAQPPDVLGEGQALMHRADHAFQKALERTGLYEDYLREPDDDPEYRERLQDHVDQARRDQSIALDVAVFGQEILGIPMVLTDQQSYRLCMDRPSKAIEHLHKALRAGEDPSSTFEEVLVRLLRQQGDEQGMASTSGRPGLGELDALLVKGVVHLNDLENLLKERSLAATRLPDDVRQEVERRVLTRSLPTLDGMVPQVVRRRL